MMWRVVISVNIDFSEAFDTVLQCSHLETKEAWAGEIVC